MTTTTYMTNDQRVAAEATQLEQAEAQFEAQHGPVGGQEAPAQEPQPSADTHHEPEQAQQTVDWEKRYKDLQSHHDKTVNELKDKIKEAGLEEDSEDEVAKLRKELEELQSKEQERQMEAHLASTRDAVSNAHPDFETVISSPAFSEWIKDQAQVYQDAIYDDAKLDATLAIDALTLFKARTNYGEDQLRAQQKQMQDQAAMSVGGGHREAPQTEQKKVWTWGEIQSLSPSQYDKLEAEIDAAIQEGRVR